MTPTVNAAGIPVPTNYIPVHGTGAFRMGRIGDWWQSGSAFSERLRKENIILSKPDDVFFWSSAIDGVLGGEETWCAAGAALRYYLQDVPVEKRNIIAHSHGGQVAMMCASGMCYPDGLIRPTPLRRLILVAMPIRKDMVEVYNQARHFIGQIVYIGDKNGDKMQWLGEFFDGDFKRRTSLDQAALNLLEPGINHSKILTEPEYTERAIKSGWFDYLR